MLPLLEIVNNVIPEPFAVDLVEIKGVLLEVVVLIAGDGDLYGDGNAFGYFEVGVITVDAVY